MSKYEQEILNTVNTRGTVTVAEIAQLLDVSDQTIRRIVKPMEKRGELKKVHGALVSNQDTMDPPFLSRMQTNRSAKVAIANCVANLIEDGSSLAIDTGSTSGFVAQILRQKRNLSVVTNSAFIASTLSLIEGNRVFMAGTQLRNHDGAGLDQAGAAFLYAGLGLGHGGLGLGDAGLGLGQAGQRLGQVGLARAGIKLAEGFALFDEGALADRVRYDLAGGFGAQLDLAVGLGLAPHGDGAVDGAGGGFQGHDADGAIAFFGGFGQRIARVRLLRDRRSQLGILDRGEQCRNAVTLHHERIYCRADEDGGKDGEKSHGEAFGGSLS